jgi:hypothetical protein
MNARVTLGYICIALSLICCSIQLITLPQDALLPPDRFLMLCLVTVIFAFGGLLSFESQRRAHLQLIMVSCFIVAIGSLLAIAGFALFRSARMEPVKYALMLFYAFLYAGFGLALSFVVHRRFGHAKA